MIRHLVASMAIFALLFGLAGSGIAESYSPEVSDICPLLFTSEPDLSCCLRVWRSFSDTSYKLARYKRAEAHVACVRALIEQINLGHAPIGH